MGFVEVYSGTFMVQAYTPALLWGAMKPLLEPLEAPQWQHAGYVAHLRQAGLTKCPTTKPGVIGCAENDAPIGFVVFFKKLLRQRTVDVTSQFHFYYKQCFVYKIILC